MPRYQQYGELDEQSVEQQDLGFLGYNNRTREDLLPEGFLTTSVNGVIDRNGKWQVRKGLLEVSEALATSGSAILLNTSSAVLPFTLADDVVNLIYASCSFSDPRVNIQEVEDFSDTTNTDYIVIATNTKATVIDVRLGNKQDVYYPTGYTVSKKGDALQAFDKVIIFQDGLVSIEWDGNINDVVAGDFVVGQSYRIETPGTTDFTTIGAADSVAGTIFTATGVGTGDGTAKTTFMKVANGAYPSLTLYDASNNTTITNGVATVSETAHGLKVGNIVICIDKGSSTLVNETGYVVSTVADANTFTFFTTSDDSTATTVKYMQKQSLGIGYLRMPAPAFGVNFQRRLAVPFKWDTTAGGAPVFQNRHDEILISKIDDTDTYDRFNGGFRFEIGSDDYLVGLHPYSDQQLIALMRDSIHVITVKEDLDTAVQNVVSTEIGCVARRSIVQIGNQIVFLSDNGVYALDFQDLYNLRGKDLPMSEPITDSINKLNKDYWQNSFAVYFDNRYFLAVPSSDSVSELSAGEGSNNVARKINRILVYNILNQSWETELFVDSPNFEIDNMIVAGNGEFKQLYIITKYGAIQYFGGTGNLDVAATSLNTKESLAILGKVETRGYNFNTNEIKKFNRFELQLESGEESVDFDVTAIVQDIDDETLLGSISGYSDGNLQPNEDFYIRGRIGNPRGYSLKLKFDNFLGRPIIKTLRMSANNTLKSTDTIE
tara:strand:- start:444 stop:2594 length:2151 start_codon:yes stop_codon:yes gene_type:complete